MGCIINDYFRLRGVIMTNMHSEVQNYLKALLEYYDFIVEKERYISPSDRIDLYGYSKSHNKTIGIEITFTSDVRKDAERLVRFAFDLAYIVVDTPRYEGKIEYHGKTIPIVHYNSFESELRKVLNISPTFPSFGSFEKWKEERIKLSEPTFTRGKLDKFIQMLKNSGLDIFVEDTVNLVGMLYIVKEIPSMYRDSVTLDIIRYGGRTKRPQYRTTIDSKILSILKNFDLVFEEARGSGELRKYFVHLTDKGKEIGKEIIAERISMNSKELDSIINEFGKMSSIIVAGTVERYVKEQILRFELSEKDLFERLILHSEHRITDYVVHRSSIARGVRVKLKYGKKQEIHPLLTLICHFITYYNYNESVRFFNRLEELGLAYEVPVYGSYSQFIHNEIRCPIEILEYIFSRRPIIESEAVLDFGSLTTLLSVSRIRDPKVAKERFKEYIRYYEIPIDKIRAILDELNSLGITSKYIELPDSGPFLIFDKGGFEETVKRRLVETALRFLG